MSAGLMLEQVSHSPREIMIDMRLGVFISYIICYSSKGQLASNPHCL